LESGGSTRPARGGVPAEVKSIQKQQTTIRKPIECAPVASRGGRESMEMAEGDPSRGDTSIVINADIRALGEQVGEK
jgi:hypothetical protein